MKPFQADVEAMARNNEFFRTVLFTGEHSQLVVMSLLPGEDIGEEVHAVDQLLYFVEGVGEAILDGRTTALQKHEILCIPAGTQHNIRNIGDGSMKLFTVYAPAEHAVGTIHSTKSEALAEEQHGTALH